MSKSFGCLLVLVAFLGSVVSIWLTFFRSQQDSEPVKYQHSVADQLDVAVIGNEFQWSFRYPGRDGILHNEDDVVSHRLLFVPPHKRVKFHITSDDYVYILGIPTNENELTDVKEKDSNKIREIAVPELTHFIDISFAKSGTYDLMVDPLCGFQSLHDPLMGQIIVTNENDYVELYPSEYSETL